LKELACSDNQITEIPSLPHGLIELRCQDNNLTKLPLLPESLKKLVCHNNPFQYPPPEVLERSLKEIKEWMDKNPINFAKSASKR